jgi:hypothetical protein
MGTIELTQPMMFERHTSPGRTLMARVLVREEALERVAEDVVPYRASFQTLYYCLENGMPPGGPRRAERRHLKASSLNSRRARRLFRYASGDQLRLKTAR